jgi:hypothetical protein
MAQRRHRVERPGRAGQSAARHGHRESGGRNGNAAGVHRRCPSRSKLRPVDTAPVRRGDKIIVCRCLPISHKAGRREAGGTSLRSGGLTDVAPLLGGASGGVAFWRKGDGRARVGLRFNSRGWGPERDSPSCRHRTPFRRYGCRADALTTGRRVRGIGKPAPRPRVSRPTPVSRASSCLERSDRSEGTSQCRRARDYGYGFGVRAFGGRRILKRLLYSKVAFCRA